MITADLIQFAGRDWKAIADSKAEYWSRVKREKGLDQAFRVAEELRREVLLRHPDWPGEEERRLDFETHVRVAAALRRVGSV